MKGAIRHFREKINLTQMQLAQLVGVSIDSVRRWENGLREPRASDIQKLCEVFGCNETELLNGPREEGFIVYLKFVPTLEGVEEEMLNNAMRLTVSEDGFVGVAGGKKFTSREDIDEVIDSVRRMLEQGFDTLQRMNGRK